MGLMRGFLAPFRAVAFVSRAGLWHMVLLPALLNVAVAGGAGWASAHYWRKELTTSAWGSGALASVLMVVLTILGGTLLFIMLQPVTGAIFNDLLGERVERRLLKEVPHAPFVAGALRALAHGLLKLLLYGIALVVGLVLGLVTAGIGTAVGIGLGALFLAYDGFDYPLARRGASFGAKWRYLALHPAQTIGYGLGATVLYYLIPLALVIAPPLAAVGATLVYVDNEQKKGRIAHEESPLRDRQG